MTSPPPGGEATVVLLAPDREARRASPTSDIVRMIRDERIITHFQPIYSVRSRSMIGVEALSRGLADDPESLISPGQMAEEAHRADRVTR